jgi:hypothetical protein
MSRPTKLDARVCDQLVAAVASGASVAAAAQWVGLDPGTVSRWRTAGRDAWEAAELEGQDPADEDLVVAVGADKLLVVRLYCGLQHAEVVPEIQASSSIVRAIERGNWRAAMAYEKRRPRREPHGYERRPKVCRQVPGKAGGRPSKLTPAVHAELVCLATRGVYAAHAAVAVGISEATYHRWMRRGEDVFETTSMDLREQYVAEGDHDAYPTIEGALMELEQRYPDELPYVRLYLDVSDAEAELGTKARRVWVNAAEKSWRAAEAFLAWEYPDQWGPNALTDEELLERDRERTRVLLEEADADDGTISPDDGTPLPRHPYPLNDFLQALADAGVEGIDLSDVPR